MANKFKSVRKTPSDPKNFMRCMCSKCAAGGSETTSFIIDTNFTLRCSDCDTEIVTIPIENRQDRHYGKRAKPKPRLKSNDYDQSGETMMCDMCATWPPVDFIVTHNNGGKSLETGCCRKTIYRT